MSELKTALENRFGKHRVSDLPVKDGEMPLLILDLEIKSPVTVIVTNGLHNYKMPVHEKFEGKEYNELYFCLPSYWEWEDLDNPRTNWVFHWIQRLAKYVVEKETWFAHGHTMPCGSEKLALSETMKQNFFLLSDPLLLQREMAEVIVKDSIPAIVGTKTTERTVHFLSIIPIFKNEMEYKQARGTFKFMQKLENKGVTEKLDDFRYSVMKNKWRLRR